MSTVYNFVILFHTIILAFFFGWNHVVVSQKLPLIVDEFCIACNNICESGPNFHRWVLSEQLVAPDNFAQIGYTINNLYPGPPIRINPSSHLVILVSKFHV